MGAEMDLDEFKAFMAEQNNVDQEMQELSDAFE